MYKPYTFFEKLKAFTLVLIGFLIVVAVFEGNQTVISASLVIALALIIYIVLARPKKRKGDSFKVSANLRYYGGGHIKREKNLVVSVTDKGLSYGNHFIDIDKIKSVSIENQEQVHSRVTATRMVAFGVFALATPKRTKSSTKYLTVEYDNGFVSTLIFEGQGVTKIHSALLRAK